MVAADHTSLHLVAGEESSKRRQILEGARKVFMELGFDAASMGEIARTAGVSKGTLYVYFADKHRLFEAIVEEQAVERGQLLFCDPAGDTKATLRNFGEAYAAMICRPGNRSAVRMVIAIAERMPELGRCYYERVVETTISRLAEYLQARVKLNELAIDDCRLAAAQFVLMCQASLFLPFIFHAAPAPSQERITEVVNSAVAMFLAAHEVKSV